jgi:hypothetical protein
MFATSATLIMTGTTFSSNTISSYTAYGGGAYLSSCTTTMSQCIFSNNIVDGWGGGLFTTGGTTTMSQTQFESNYASTGGGFFATGTKISVSTSTFIINAAVNGGGVYVECSAQSTENGADVKFSFVMFRGNKASSSGGGCYNSGGKVQFRSCTWLSNEAQSSAGGALYLTGSASATTLMTYEFNSNSASSYNDVYKASGTLVVDNGCSEGEYTYGSGILMCYGCSLTYPANLSHIQCRPWAAEVEVQSGKELAGAVMHNSTATIITDVTVFSELAVVGFIPLTGVVFNGKGIYTIQASQDLQRRRALLATATTR